MRLAALSIGPGAPTGDFAGSVLAVHRRACVLALADESLLTLVTPTVGHLPRAILVDAPTEFVFAKVVGVNADFAARSGIVRFADSALSVDLRAANWWRPRLSDLTLGGVGVAPARRTARRALDANGASAPLVLIAGPRLTALAAATRALDASAASDAMAGLVGLGEGATPAGDDYLVGFFAGLWASAAGATARTAFVGTLGDRLKRMSSRTGRISQVYLDAAAEGDVSERLFDLASTIANGSNETIVERAAAAALAIGHSSGACGVLGLLDAGDAWSGSAPANQRGRS